MNIKFIIVLASIGWFGFRIFSDKYGIKLLTLEFLSTLQTQQDGIYFRMFNQDFSLTWSALKTALGFDHDCSLDLNHATRRFDKVEVLAVYHHLV